MRLLILFLFAALPILAGAHEGHRAHAQSAPVETSAPAQAPVVGTVSAASSRCPGGDHEACCCHELTATTPSPSAGVADRGWRELALRLATRPLPQGDERAPQSAASIHFDTRGPPLLS